VALIAEIYAEKPISNFRPDSDFNQRPTTPDQTDCIDCIDYIDYIDYMTKTDYTDYIDHSRQTRHSERSEESLGSKNLLCHGSYLESAFTRL
jgi:hypothetical protein